MCVSLTPTDEPDSQARPRRQQPESESRTTSARSHVFGGLSRVSERLSETLRSVTGWITGRTSEHRASELDDSAAVPEACPQIGSLPPRALPLTYPTRSYRRLQNLPDTVASCDGSTYRIVHPDEPDCYIESDTWTTVER